MRKNGGKWRSRQLEGMGRGRRGEKKREKQKVTK